MASASGASTSARARTGASTSSAATGASTSAVRERPAPPRPWPPRSPAAGRGGRGPAPALPTGQRAQATSVGLAQPAERSRPRRRWPAGPPAWRATSSLTRETSAPGGEQLVLGRGLEPPRQPRTSAAATSSSPATAQPDHGLDQAVSTAASTPATAVEMTGTVTRTCASTTSVRSSTTPASTSARAAAPEPGGGERHEARRRRRCAAAARSSRAASCETQPLPVAEQRPRDAERAHRDDRREQGEDDRLLAGPHDEPAGRRGQGDAGGRRSTAEQAAARCGRWAAEQARGWGRLTAPPPALARPARGARGWSARADELGPVGHGDDACAARRGRAMASCTRSTASASRWAVGSSSEQHRWRSRAAARARASRGRWPADSPKPSSPSRVSQARGQGGDDALEADAAQRRPRWRRRPAPLPSGEVVAQGAGGEERPLASRGGRGRA